MSRRVWSDATCVLLVLLASWMVQRAWRPASAVDMDCGAPASEARQSAAQVRLEPSDPLRAAAAESPEALMAELAKLTTPTARTRSEQERLARDRATYRELASKSNRTDMETSIMRAIEEQSRYPAHNQRFLLERHDPVLRAREVERRSATSADGNLRLTVFTDRKQYEPGSTLRVTALLDATGGRAQQPLPTTLSAVLRGENGSDLSEFKLTTNAAGHYEGVLELAADGPVRQPGLYLVRVGLDAEVSQSAAFMLQPSYARLTGQYRDTVVAGALVLSAEVNVDTDGDYQLMASLYTDDGFPVGVSERTYTLTRGTHWLEFDYYGKLLHDAARAGPYRLAHVQIAQLTFPVAEGVEADPEYWTAAYSVSDFDSKAYNVLTGEEEEDGP
ncbi:MAG: hypothetical protein QM778_34710 [Myxococcales bacterium]